MSADPHHAHGSAFDAVKAAVSANADALIPLLGDADPQVRAAAAYALAQCGAPPAPLWDRRAVEEDADVRASLAFALGLLDPARAVEDLSRAVVHAPPVERVAAALALTRNGEAWPDGAAAAVVGAMDDAEVEYAWQRHADWTDDLLVETDDALATTLLRQMFTAPSAQVRRAGVWGMTVRGQARRTTPALLLPLVRPLLDDPDEGVRGEVVGALRRSGRASARFADELRTVAARYPRTAHQVAITPELKAVETLMLLGDPGWIDPVCAAVAADPDTRRIRLLHHGMPWSRRAFDEVRRRLAAPAGRDAATVSVLATVLGQWGSDAAPAVPELLAVLPHAGEAVSRALSRIGHTAPETEPYLRAFAERTGDLEAALDAWRMTDDARLPIEALNRLLTGERVQPPRNSPDLGDVGSHLLPLVPAARHHLTGTAAATYPQRDVQVLAARVLSAATGDPAPALPTVRAVLEAGGTSASGAAGLVADLATTFRTGVGDLEPVLRGRLDDRWSTVAAARALWRLGTPPAELIVPLIAAIPAPYGGRGAVALLVDMGAVDAVADLDRLARRDERIVTSGIDDDIVWQDERLQDRLREAVVALREL
jgi:HEAT repeat protein